MDQTILKSREFILCSPVRRDYPHGYIEQHIRRQEEMIFRNCLGILFYKDLINELNEDQEGKCYSRNSLYSNGDVIELDGLLYRSTRDMNSENPVDLEDWELVEKFNTPQYNDLWNKYLKFYISYYVLYTSVGYSNQQVGARGVVQFGNDETNVSGVKNPSDYKRELRKDINDYLFLINEFINESDTTLFDNSKLRKKGSCYQKVCLNSNNRRIMLRDEEGDY